MIAQKGEEMSGRSSWVAAAIGLAVPVLAVFAVLAQAPSLDKTMARLYADRRYFELEALLGTVKENTPDTFFYRGMMANAFNRPAESADFLTSLLKAAGRRLAPAVASDMLLALSDDYARLGEYAKAADARMKALPFVKKKTGPSEFAAFESTIALWTAMSDAPPQSVEVPADTDIALTRAGEIPVRIKGLEIPMLPDTGSALSMIARLDAERLGLEILDVTVEIGTSAGTVVQTRPCLVPELRLGRVIVRNAIFLVVPSDMFDFTQPGLQRHGLLAFPILDGLGEMTFTRDGRFIVTAQPRLQGPPNFFLASTDAVLEAEYKGRRLMFMLDTGGFSTELFRRFFKTFEEEILRHGRYEPATIEGVGSRARTPVYFMKGLTFLVAGRPVRFDKALPVLTRAVGKTSSDFDGSFGLDLLAGYQELTLNYEAMRISLR
jgi:hypothetical protein